MHVLALAVPSAVQSLAATPNAGSVAATGSAITSDIASFVATTVPSLVASALPAGITSSSPAALTQPLVLVPPQYEFIATFVGAFAGALVGVRRRFDIIGVLTLAVVGGLGGGMIRDILLQKYGIAAFQHDYLLISALIAALVGFYFAGVARLGRSAFVVVDAVSLGLFAVIGADKGLSAQLSVFAAIFLGVITSTGGGVIRDLLIGEVPSALQPGSLYAAAATLGSIAFVTMVVWLNIVKPVAAITAVVITLGLRTLSLRLGWQTPVPVDLTPRVTRLVPERVRRVSRRVSAAIPGVPAPKDSIWAEHDGPAPECEETEETPLEDVPEGDLREPGTGATERPPPQDAGGARGPGDPTSGKQ